MPGFSGHFGPCGPRSVPRALAQAALAPTTRRAARVGAAMGRARLGSAPRPTTVPRLVRRREAVASARRLPSSRDASSVSAPPRRACAARAAAGASRVVSVRIRRSVPFGHSVRLVGEGDALGSWDPSRAPELTWGAGDVWEGRLSLDAGASAPVACKAVELDAEGRPVAWEDGANRELPDGAGRGAAVSFAWNDPEIEVARGEGAERPAAGGEEDSAGEDVGGASEGLSSSSAAGEDVGGASEGLSSSSAAGEDLDQGAPRAWVGSAPKLMQSNEHSRERPPPPPREAIERLPIGSAARIIAEGDLEAASWLDKLGVALEALEKGDDGEGDGGRAAAPSPPSASAIPTPKGPPTPSAATAAAARLYLEWIASGAVPCVESGGHYRPNHHAELSMKAFLLLERAAEAGMREEEQAPSPASAGASFEVPPPPLGPSPRALAARAAAVRLPGFSAALRQAVPLTSIRDLAHRGDIPQALKLELKHTLQNKLHRNAGPEDLVVAEEILRRLRLAREVRRGATDASAAGDLDVAKYGDVSEGFFEAYESFMRELRDFFSATSLLDCLDEAAESLPSEGDRALVRRVRPALGMLERAERVCAREAERGGAALEDLQAEGRRESDALALTLRALGGVPGGPPSLAAAAGASLEPSGAAAPDASSPSPAAAPAALEDASFSPHDPTPGKGLLQYIMDALHAATSARAVVLAALQSGVRPSATPEALSNRHRLRVAESLAEQQAFALLSRFCNRLEEAGGAEAVARGTDAAWALPIGALVLALRHAALGGGLAPAEAHAVECELAAWQQAGGFADPRGDAARRLLATLGRVQRLAGRYAEASLATYGALARELGPALGVPRETYQVFAEAEVRASVLFQAAKVAAALARACRLACGAPSAEALVGGAAVGLLLEAPDGLEPDCLEKAIARAAEGAGGAGPGAPAAAAAQGVRALLAAASNRVVLSVPFATGDEELGGLVRRPAGEPRLAGVVLGQELPHLSHLGVRARQERLPFVLVPDEVERRAAVDPLVGSIVRVEASEAPSICPAGDGDLEAEAPEGGARGAPETRASEGGPRGGGRSAAPPPPAAAPLKPEVASRPVPVPLSEATRATCGAKASSCGELVRLSARLGGFAAPDGLALPYGTLEHLARKNRATDELERLLDAVDAENDAIREAELAAAATAGASPQAAPRPASAAAALRRLILSLALPRDWLATIARCFPPGSALMVRSSANVEDLAGMSGAGLYDSVRNVPSGDLAAIERAVREVLASLWSERACGARRTAGVRARDAHMAVAVQAQLPADVCFVLHTAHPSAPDALEAELAAGHGETLAAGTRGTPWRLRVEGHKGAAGAIEVPVAEGGSGAAGDSAEEAGDGAAAAGPAAAPAAATAPAAKKATVTTESFANFSLAYLVPSRRGKSFSPPSDTPPPTPVAVPFVVDYSRQLLSVEREAREALGRALGAIGAALEDHFGGPQDVEGVLVGKTIYIVQTRPQPMAGAMLRFENGFHWSQPIVAVAAALLLAYAVLIVYRAWQFRRDPSTGYRARPVGKLTIYELSKFDGSDPSRPILLALDGTIYDVTLARNFYGPGGGYHVLAGREAARALALMSLREEDCTSELGDLTEEQRATLEDWKAKFALKYPKVGELTPPLELTADELAQHDGRDPAKPLFVSIRGVVFDVTPGRHFYGPDGAYPFAGRECSRALARFSVEEADLNDDLSGLSLAELDALNDWLGQFHSKYRVVGKLVK